MNVFAIDTPSSTHGVTTITNTPAQTPLSSNLPTSTTANNIRIQQTDGIYNINPDVDPFCATTMIDINTPTLPTTSTALPPTSTALNASSFMSPRQSFYNPRMSVPLYHAGSYTNNPNPTTATDLDPTTGLHGLPQEYAFNDLDTLFDGFFDLSMPTMFEDPIYEGAAYDMSNWQFITGGPFASGGHSGAGSVDMSYVGGGAGPGPSGYTAGTSAGFDTAMGGMSTATAGGAQGSGQRSRN